MSKISQPSLQEICQHLAALPSDSPTRITIETARKQLEEINWVSGEWQGHTYSFDLATLWRSGEIYCECLTAEEVVGLLQGKNTLRDLTSQDFPELLLNYTSDGDCDYGEVTWSPALTAEEIPQIPETSDLYQQGNIDDSEYVFGSGGIYSLQVECESYSAKIVDP